MLPAWKWHFDIDQYINPYLFVPPWTFSRDSLLRPEGPSGPPQRPLGNVVCILWAIIGTAGALSLISVIDRQILAFQPTGGAPITIGSFGAATVLQFYVIDSPSSQPRNAILGQLVSSVIGVAINKGFARMPVYRQDDLRWLAGAMACPCSITAMALTGTVHPPGGATALVAVTDPNVGEIGWAFVPMVLLNCVIMLAVALLVNNIQRVRYPAYWWTPGEVGSFWARERPESEEETDLSADTIGEKREREAPHDGGSTAATSNTPYDVGCRIILTRDRISVPPHIDLLPEEKACLECLCQRLYCLSEAGDSRR